MRTQLVAMALLAAFASAAAQTALPYAIETFGAFRKVILEGDFTPKVSLGAVMAKNRPWASAPWRPRAAKSRFTTAG